MARKKPPNVPQVQNTRISASAMYIAPIPSSEQLAGYENTLPGAADRILQMAEKQAAHRQQIELIAVQSNATNSKYGILAGAVLGLAAIGAGTYVAINADPQTGFYTCFTGIAALSGVFIFGKWVNKQELQEKQKMIQ